jgi:4-carboxymuconolactone decarboxylase
MRPTFLRSKRSRLAAAAVALSIFPGMPLFAQGRLPPIPPEKMTDEQKKAAAEYEQIRGNRPGGPPWSVILRVPEMLVPSLQMRMHYIDGGAIGLKVAEFAILIAARRMSNNYEWQAHAPAALKAGVKQEIVAALADGRRPEGMSEDEEIAYEYCTELQTNQSVSDATYARALARFGEAGVVDLAAIQGYYTYLAMIMNAARVEVDKPALERFPTGQGTGR